MMTITSQGTHLKKNVFLLELRRFASGSGADSIIQLCLFSLFSIEKMQFFCREKALLTQITCCALNKDWLSGFSLFRNTVRHVLDSIGCTLFAVRAAIPVNEKIPTSRKLYADGWQHFMAGRCSPGGSPSL